MIPLSTVISYQAVERMRLAVFRYLQSPPPDDNENDRHWKIENIISRLEREFEEENDTKKLTVLKAEIEELKRKLSELK